ncbi:MAG: hypothetical protein GY862_23300, partial [Gammaproteobacteria bacterium]|nr:hypothetical protein [Gammaproteobacteria bacterium]
PKKGGLYVFQTVLKLDEAESKTEVFVLMPWAGAGIDAWLVNEVDGMCQKAEAWRAAVMKTAKTGNLENPAKFSLNAFLAVSKAYFDYEGLAISADGKAPTRRFSYTDDDLPADMQDGGDWNDPSYATLQGLVVYRAKVNNLLWAVYGHCLGFDREALLMGAFANAFFRVQEESASARNAMVLGSHMFDAWRTSGTAAEALTKSEVKGMQFDNFNDFNLWPYPGQAARGFMLCDPGKHADCTPSGLPTDYDSLKDGGFTETGDRRYDDN